MALPKYKQQAVIGLLKELTPEQESILLGVLHEENSQIGTAKGSANALFYQKLVDLSLAKEIPLQTNLPAKITQTLTSFSINEEVKTEIALLLTLLTNVKLPYRPKMQQFLIPTTVCILFTGYFALEAISNQEVWNIIFIGATTVDQATMLWWCATLLFGALSIIGLAFTANTFRAKRELFVNNEYIQAPANEFSTKSVTVPLIDIKDLELVKVSNKSFYLRIHHSAGTLSIPSHALPSINSFHHIKNHLYKRRHFAATATTPTKQKTTENNTSETQDTAHKPPELVHIPVYRDTFVSQERTDSLCELLWENRPEDLYHIASEIAYGFPDCRVGKFRKHIRNVEIFLRNEATSGSIAPISYTAMVDVCFEVDRRIRYALNAEEIPIFGKPIAPSPNGPFPSWPQCTKSQYATEEMTQELSDTLSNNVYQYFIEHAPEVLFANVENHRRNLQGGETSEIIRKVARKLTPSEYKLPMDAVLWEFTQRLFKLYRDDPA